MIGAAERKAAERRRRRDAGFVLVQEWVHRTCSADLKRHAAKLRRLHQLAENPPTPTTPDCGENAPNALAPNVTAPTLGPK